MSESDADDINNNNNRSISSTSNTNRKRRAILSDSDADVTQSSVDPNSISSSTQFRKKKYTQKFVASWEREFKVWLTRLENGSAHCKYCNVDLGSKRSILTAHSKTKKHQLKCGQFDQKRQLKLNDLQLTSKKLKRLKAEAWACMFVAEHGSLMSVNHLTEGCNVVFADSEAAGIQLKRTKCSAVIRNVLCPFFREQLKNDIGEMPYSILFDETTDIETKKVLSAVVRYVDLKLQKVICTFLGMIEIPDGLAETLAAGVQKLVDLAGLDYKKCQGIGTDNASANVGIYNGARVHLEKLFGKKLFLGRCVNHSIQLAVSEASTLLSEKLEFLIQHTYSWFSKSTKRQQKYTEIYRLLLHGKEGAEKPLKMKRWATTRWLSVYSAIERIVDQYDALKEYFKTERTGCVIADTLYIYYNDLAVKAQLFYLKRVLKPVWQVNMSFQSDNDGFSLMNDLQKLILDLGKLILNPTARVNILTASSTSLSSYIDPSLYFGEACEKILRGIPDKEIVSHVRRKCTNFVLKLIEQLKQRLPDNMALLENIKELSVSRCLRAHRANFLSQDLLSELQIPSEKLDMLEIQWCTLSNVHWDSASSNDGMKLWFEIYNYTNSKGENTYREIAEFAFTILSLPLSNASVERVFSFLNIIKSKLRNRLYISTVDAIIMVKTGLLVKNKNCYNYILPDNVIQNVGTSQKYSNTPSNTVDIKKLDEDDCLEEVLNFIPDLTHL